METKEIGGYIELERYSGREYYQDAVALNCGRNCLRYLIEVRNIKKISLPYFLCESVNGVCKKAGIEIRYYHINESFLPVLDFQPDEGEYLYIVNFYGQVNDGYFTEIKKQYGNVIIDNAQAFFHRPIPHADTIYVPRKYFGVADGAYVATDIFQTEAYEVDVSNKRVGFLLGRFEETASQYYEAYLENEEQFVKQPIRRMSYLTHNLLRGIDYEEVRQKRNRNFHYLQNRLREYNLLNVQETEGPFAYPFFIKQGSLLRKALQEKKIYVPTLWPNVLKECAEESLEYQYAKDILPLPVDQRYDSKNMEYIVENIITWIKLL